jgi:hypothetical protein
LAVVVAECISKKAMQKPDMNEDFDSKAVFSKGLFQPSTRFQGVILVKQPCSTGRARRRAFVA